MTDEPRYIPRSLIRNNSIVAWSVYDTVTNQWLNASYPLEYQAQERANELNRLTALVGKVEEKGAVSLKINSIVLKRVDNGV